MTLIRRSVFTPGFPIWREEKKSKTKIGLKKNYKKRTNKIIKNKVSEIAKRIS